MEEPKYVPVYSVEGTLAGDMVRLMLESFGIDAIIAQESIGKTYGLNVGPMSEVTILVPDSQAEAAKEILASMEAGDFEKNGNDQIPGAYDNKDHEEN